LLHRARQIAVGVALTAGLLAFGFFVTGTRVDALGGRSTPGAIGLQPLPGSQVRHTTLLVDGQPTRVSECTTPALVGAVLAKYATLAGTEAAATGAPYLVQESPGAAAVVWLTADGRRRAVLLDAHPQGGTAYRLLETLAAPTASTTASRLPRGMDLPRGMTAFLSVERPGGGGFAMLSSSGPVATTAELLLASLARVGLAVDPSTGSLRHQGPGGQVTLPLDDGQGGRGVLVVTPDGDGGARASISIE
jgi:hypothetical protein